MRTRIRILPECERLPISNGAEVDTKRQRRAEHSSFGLLHLCYSISPVCTYHKRWIGEKMMMLWREREGERALKIPDGKEDLSELMVLFQVRKEV